MATREIPERLKLPPVAKHSAQGALRHDPKFHLEASTEARPALLFLPQRENACGHYRARNTKYGIHLGSDNFRLPLSANSSPAMKPESTITACACGAHYERQERTLPIKDIGLFECIDCGARLEIWSGRKVPVFKRITPEAAQKRSA